MPGLAGLRRFKRQHKVPPLRKLIVNTVEGKDSHSFLESVFFHLQCKFCYWQLDALFVSKKKGYGAEMRFHLRTGLVESMNEVSVILNCLPGF